MGFTEATPIQEKAIPAILNQRDLIACAQTGTGKTAAFVLPSLHQLVENPTPDHVKVLVIVPTRELAMQVNEVFWQFNKILPNRIKSLAVHGGVSINPQMMAIQNTHVLVATPGRLIELVESNAVSLADVQTLILDEADKLLNKGFEKELQQILDFLQTNSKLMLIKGLNL